MVKEKTKGVSIRNRNELLGLERYALYSLEKNEYNFTMTMNVPTDGWCLLYAIQFALLIEHGINVDLFRMRLALLNEYERRIKDNQDDLKVKLEKIMFSKKISGIWNFEL